MGTPLAFFFLKFNPDATCPRNGSVVLATVVAHNSNGNCVGSVMAELDGGPAVGGKLQAILWGLKQVLQLSSR